MFVDHFVIDLGTIGEHLGLVSTYLFIHVFYCLVWNSNSKCPNRSYVGSNHPVQHKRSHSAQEQFRVGEVFAISQILCEGCRNMEMAA